MINLNYKTNNILILISIISLFYILFTNVYFSVSDSFIFGAADGLSFLKIANASPNISTEIIQPIHSERFIVSYLIGILSKLFFLENYEVFRYISILSILILNYLIFKILFLFNISFNNKIFAVLLINLNPYVTRFYISNPLMINDLIFHIGVLISILSITTKNKKLFYSGLIISIIARQSGVAVFIAVFFVKIIMNDKFFLDKKDIFYSFILITVLYLIGYIYSLNTIAHANDRYDQYYVTVLGIFLENKSLKELLIFFSRPLLCFLPLIVFTFLSLKIKAIKIQKNIDLNIYIIVFSFLIILQPTLQGIDVSGKNIIRLTSYAFIPLLIFNYINSTDNEANRFIKNIFLIILLFVWSSHPTFSTLSFLDSYRF